jgi:hypothetical protein
VRQAWSSARWLCDGQSARWSTEGSMTLFHGCIVRTPANSTYRSSPAPSFMLFSFIAFSSAKTSPCYNFFSQLPFILAINRIKSQMKSYHDHLSYQSCISFTYLPKGGIACSGIKIQFLVEAMIQKYELRLSPACTLYVQTQKHDARMYIHNYIHQS